MGAFRDFRPDKAERRVRADGSKVFDTAGRAVVKHRDGVAFPEQPLDQVRTDESGAAGD
jgi:hypothetical protein